jgi:hypothetical protein
MTSDRKGSIRGGICIGAALRTEAKAVVAVILQSADRIARPLETSSPFHPIPNEIHYIYMFPGPFDFIRTTEQILGLSNCSTWNNLVWVSGLFQGG